MPGCITGNPGREEWGVVRNKVMEGIAKWWEEQQTWAEGGCGMSKLGHLTLEVCATLGSYWFSGPSCGQLN